MVNLIISFEKFNLNPYIDSFALQDRNIFINEQTSEKTVRDVFNELSALNRNTSPRVRLCASRFSEIRMFDINDIIYIESFGNLKCINGLNDSFEFYGTLRKIHDIINELGFVQIHKSYIVSVAHIKKAGTYHVQMADGKIINVGRKYASKYKMAVFRQNEIILNRAGEWQPQN